MPQKRTRKIFVNLPVRDLKRSTAFFGTLGSEFDPKFTNENAACMIVSEDAYVMLLVEPFFRTFTYRQPCDTARHSEGLFALSCDSRAEVDDLVRKAISAGGKHAMDPMDQEHVRVELLRSGRAPLGARVDGPQVDPKAAPRHV